MLSIRDKFEQGSENPTAALYLLTDVFCLLQQLRPGLSCIVACEAANGSFDTRGSVKVLIV